jgi:hypothetical protein
VTRAGLLLLGLVVGLAGAALHQSFLWLTVAFLAGAAVTAATPPPGRIWWAVGFAAVPLALSWPQGEGDVVLAGTASLLLACQAALWLGIGLAGLLPAGRPARPAPQPVHDPPPPPS